MSDLEDALAWARRTAGLEGTSLECIPEDHHLGVILEDYDRLAAQPRAEVEASDVFRSRFAEERQRANDYLEQLKDAHKRTEAAEAERDALREALRSEHFDAVYYRTGLSQAEHEEDEPDCPYCALLRAEKPETRTCETCRHLYRPSGRSAKCGREGYPCIGYRYWQPAANDGKKIHARG